MRKVLLTLPLLAVTTLAAADSFTIHPTVPGTSIRDWSSDRLGWRVDTDRGTIQPTIPGTSLRTGRNRTILSMSTKPRSG